MARTRGTERDEITPGADAPPSFFTVHEGDTRNLEFLLAHHSSPEEPLLTCTITSPPYGQLKNYGHPDQIGWGQSHDDYLIELRRVFRHVHRHTRYDGAMWVIADSFRPEEPNGALRRLEPLPFQLASEAGGAGWVLRDIIIWRKDKTLPWSGRGRLRNAFEYILYFVKSDEFKYHVDRIRDPIELEEWWVKWPERYNPEGKVPENVWDIPIPVQGSWNQTAVKHACPLPPDLVERLVLLSTDPNDVVFDPFAGTGVVVAEAERLGRRGLGIELVRRYVKAYRTLVRPAVVKRNRDDELGERQRRAQWLRETISNLRVVKYPKVLLQGLERAKPPLPRPALAVALALPSNLPGPRDPYKFINAAMLFLLGPAEEGYREDLTRELKELASRPPASKFGIAGEIVLVTWDELVQRAADHELYLYVNGRTHESAGATTMADLLALTIAGGPGRFPPIAANVELHEVPRALKLKS